MGTRSSRTTEDLVELDFTTGRKRSQRTHRVQVEPEVLVTETMDVPKGNGNPLGNGLGRARQPRPIGLGDAPNRHQQRQGIVPPPVDVFWSILEHMGHEEHGGTWHMEAAQLDTQRKKGEAILKTSSTVYSTNRSSSSTRPAKLQLDRAEKSTVKPEKCCFPLDFPLTLNLILFVFKG
ncbi:unnamed protein product [Microthlaspi erraticum]|uniref:Uncharacterized protein n=1 Tax=Microthlaspi erraticum TaxID=1685480 RepID=A0A6D2I0P2_9BRAS|nr:unnamed protein product [Microthlaspi erraticum]